MKEIYYTNENIQQTAQDLLAQLSPYSKHSNWLPDLTNSALLVIDLQNYFFNPLSNAFIPSARAIINNIQNLCELFEHKNRPIIFTSHEYKPEPDDIFNRWWNKTGEPIADNVLIIEELKKYSSLLIKKSNYDSFAGTNLENILKNNNIKDLIITGVMTHLCCESTIRSAFDKNFRIFFPIDATADYNKLFHHSAFISLAHGFCVPVLTQQIIDLSDVKYE